MAANIIAEIVAIGDELTCGFRLDTNTQWLAQQLGDLGITVMYHSTVGDDIDANVNVFRNAIHRADVVISTGGLGPTADDLTRHALATAAGVELTLYEDQLEHLKSFFERRGRTMTPTNEIQAYFPTGAVVVPNPEGTAPGIELLCPTEKRKSTVFCLPGVPAEMKQMFAGTLQKRLQAITGETGMIHHHVVRCFGTGESYLESLLPDIVKRGRDPQVGITASRGVISLRLTTKSDSVESCLLKMAPTLETIKECLGDLVFGYNDDTLPSVVAEKFKLTKQRIAIADAGLMGAPALLLQEAGAPIAAAEAVPFSATDVVAKAEAMLEKYDAGVSIAIGPVEREEAIVAAGKSEYVVAVARKGGETMEHHFMFSGHSAIRESLASKRVINLLRLMAE